MNDFMTGLMISIMGLLITFIALGFFILTMVILQRIFPYKEEETPEDHEETIAIEVNTDDEDRILAAVITSAVLAIQIKEQTNLGDQLRDGRSEWWVSHLTKALQKNKLWAR